MNCRFAESDLVKYEAMLDQSFFRVRLDRATQVSREMEFDPGLARPRGVDERGE